MKMDDAFTLGPAAPPAVAPEVFQQIGAITRLLHDTLQELGVMPRLQIAAEGLPDARSRLSYIATKTAEAATKVLNSVDRAKLEQTAIASATREMAAAIAASPAGAVDSASVLDFVQKVEARSAQIDSHLSDIMVSQDFHDLTGQVVARVLSLATELEVSLVELLVKVVPEEKRLKIDVNALHGPVVSAEGRSDVVSSQGEVDELLASMGF